MLENAIQMATAQQLRLALFVHAGKTQIEFFSDPMEIATLLMINTILVSLNDMSFTV
jgi:hypothetical protein